MFRYHISHILSPPAPVFSLMVFLGVLHGNTFLAIRGRACQIRVSPRHIEEFSHRPEHAYPVSGARRWFVCLE